jgi:ubiquinone biosynthesis protein
MAGFSHFGHGLRAVLVLLRQDALIPKEVSHLLPPVARFGMAVVRFVFAKRSKLRVGARFAVAYAKLGPAFIKLGQVLSTRGDIFGTEFTEDLSHLKDQLAPFSQGVAEKSIEAALGQPVSEIFSSFGEVIGSASIAQAHRATLIDGRDVAVKILRPDIEAIVAADVGLLRWVAKWVHDFVPSARRLEPIAFAETVAETLKLELDLRLEAAACDELCAVMAKDPYMRAPKIAWHQVAKRVLVMEWAQGMALSRPEALRIEGLDKQKTADNLIRAFLSSALNYGVFHADLHEGNLFVAAPDKLVAVDFGIVGRLRPEERRYLAVMLWGFLRRDYKRVAEVHFEAGYVPNHHNVVKFAQALRAVGEPVLGRRATEVSMGRLLGQLFEITAQFDMHLRPELVLLQKTMVSVEGVARRIMPDHDLWEAARPVVKAWIAREMSPVAEIKRLWGRLNARLERDDSAVLAQKATIEALGAELKKTRRFQMVMFGMVVILVAAFAAWQVLHP